MPGGRQIARLRLCRSIALEIGDPRWNFEQDAGGNHDHLHANRHDPALGIASGLDQAGQVRQRSGAAGRCRFWAAVDLPLGDQAIRRNTRVEGVGALAVHVVDVAASPVLGG